MIAREECEDACNEAVRLGYRECNAYPQWYRATMGLAAMARALLAERDNGRLVLKNEAEERNEAIYVSLDAHWKQARPCIEAQNIRSRLGCDLDPKDEMPDYVWRLLDIGIQRGMNNARLAALREVRGMPEAERNTMSVRQAAFERMDNDDAVRDLSKDISYQTRRINAIGQMEEEIIIAAEVGK